MVLLAIYQEEAEHISLEYMVLLLDGVDMRLVAVEREALDKEEEDFDIQDYS